MSEKLTLWHVLDVFARRAQKRLTPYSSKAEIAKCLKAERVVTDPPVDDAIAKGHLVVHPRYQHSWMLTEGGQTCVDEAAFT